MQQDQNQTLSRRFQQYRASKAVLFWACAGSALVATIVGFSWGGWVTGGSAREMADNCAMATTTQQVIRVCRKAASSPLSKSSAKLLDLERHFPSGDSYWVLSRFDQRVEASRSTMSATAGGGCAFYYVSMTYL